MKTGKGREREGEKGRREREFGREIGTKEEREEDRLQKNTIWISEFKSQQNDQKDNRKH